MAGIIGDSMQIWQCSACFWRRGARRVGACVRRRSEAFYRTFPSLILPRLQIEAASKEGAGAEVA